MKKTLKKALCVFLSTLIIFQILPLTAWAKESVEKYSIENINAESTDYNDITIDSEIESMRTENSKTFLTDNNGYYQITSSTPIHNYENGRWIDPVEKESEKIETIAQAQAYVDDEIQAYTSDNSTLSSELSNDRYEDDCETLIKQYYSRSSTSNREFTVRSSKRTKKAAEIYIKPYFPTDHAVFVTNATITATIDELVTNYNTISVNRITQNWNESLSSSTKLSCEMSSEYDLQVIQPTYDENDEAAEPIMPTECEFDFTNFCNYSSLGLYNNYGVALTAADSGTEIVFSQIKVSMYYHELNDTDARFETEQLDMGRAGKVYINDYTCSPTIVRDEMGLYGEIAPVNIQTIFNPLSDNIDSGMGALTRLNYYSTIEYDLNMYYWKNCEGENLYFIKVNDKFNEFTSVGSDDNSYTLTIDRTGDTYDYTNYDKITITDSNGKSYKFTKHSDKGYLTKIYDGSNNNNQIVINYGAITESKYNITSIIDGSGRIYNFAYTNGYLSNLSVTKPDNTPICITIDDNQSVPISITYTYSNGLLSSVTYPDNNTVDYTYDINSSKLKRIDNIDDSYVEFTYESQFSNESYKLASYVFKNDGNTSESVTITDVDQNIYERTFYSSLYDNPKKLMFDKSFNMIYLRDFNSIEYYFDYSNNELKYILPNNNSSDNYIRNGEFNLFNDGTEFPQNWSYVKDDDDSFIEVTEKEDEHVNSEKNVDANCLYMSTNTAVCKAYQFVEKIDGSYFAENSNYLLSASLLNENALSINNDRNLSINVFDVKEDESNGALIPNNCIAVMEFDDTLAGEWQTRKTLVTITEDTPALFVYLCYDNMFGECYFDSIKLVDSTAYNTIEAESIIPSSKITYTYDNNNSIISEVQTSVLGKSLGTTYTYDDSGNYLSSITNEGLSTYYQYDSDNGLLKSRGPHSNSNNNTQFSYTAMGLLNSVKQATTQIDGTSTNINTNYTYENDKIKTITHNGFAYIYDYDAAGRVSKISQGSNDLVSYSYDNNRVNTITYSNGATISYIYNPFNYITQITYNANTDNSVPITYEYIYDDYGNVISYKDNSNSTIATKTSNTFTLKEQGENGKIIYRSTPSSRSLFGVQSSISRTSSENLLGQITERTIDTFPNNIITTTSLYDSVGRTFETVSKDKNVSVRNIATYISNGTNATNFVDTYYSSVFTNKDTNILKSNIRISRSLTYEYTDEGQIKNIYRKSVNNIPENTENTASSETFAENVLIKHYEYDEAGEIILDANFDSKKVIKYKYDNGGNMVSKTIYDNNDDTKIAYSYNSTTKEFTFYDNNAEIISYEYDSQWKDLLSSYKSTPISYDPHGNPTYYAGENIVGNEVEGAMIWNGTRLESFDDGNNKYFYKYSADGYRTQKLICNADNVNIWESKIDYVYKDDTLVGYKTTLYEENTSHAVKSEIVITLIYNGNGESVGIDAEVTSYEDGTPQTQSIYYSLLRDAQGNITDMYSSDENMVFHYSYDAYGNCTFTFSGNALHEFKQQLNNLSNDWAKLLIGFFMGLALAAAVGGTVATTQQTYRGYICDYETGLYYSQNRYYSPSWGRFINLDDTNILTHNKGEVFGANLFNYCNNDPINNVDLSGYAPTSYNTSNNILSALDIEQINSVEVGIVPPKMYGEVTNQLTLFGMCLSTVKNESEKEYWRRVFSRTDSTVGKFNGYNYMNTVINNESGAANMYSIKANKFPYNLG